MFGRKNSRPTSCLPSLGHDKILGLGKFFSSHLISISSSPICSSMLQSPIVRFQSIWKVHILRILVHSSPLHSSTPESPDTPSTNNYQAEAIRSGMKDLLAPLVPGSSEKLSIVCIDTSTYPLVISLCSSRTSPLGTESIAACEEMETPISRHRDKYVMLMRS